MILVFILIIVFASVICFFIYDIIYKFDNYDFDASERFLNDWIWVKSVYASCKTKEQFAVADNVYLALLNKYKKYNINPTLISQTNKELIAYYGIR